MAESPRRNKAGVGTLPGEIGAQQLEIAAFAAVGDVDIKQIDGLPFLLILNTDGTGHTITLISRGGVSKGGPVSIPVKLPPNSAITVPTSVFASANDAQGNGNCYWALCDVPISYNAPGLTPIGATGVPQTQGGSIGVVVTGATQDDDQSLGPTSIAAQTAEAVSKAGATVVPVRHLVYFQGSAGPPALATAADVLVYVALKGHTSAEYYVVMFAGTGYSGQFEFPTGGAGEKLDIVTANADTVAHAFAFHWAANGSG